MLQQMQNNITTKLMANNLEREFCSYEQALALKELGFNESCFGCYQLSELRDYKKGLEVSWIMTLNTLNGYRIYDDETQTSAPLKQQVFRWFQNKYNWYHTMDFRRKAYPSTNQYKWKIDIGLGDVFFIGWADTYEEAENACIDKLIELAKQQKNGEKTEN